MFEPRTCNDANRSGSGSADPPLPHPPPRPHYQKISDAGDAMQRSRACWPSKAGDPKRVVDTTEITDGDGTPLPCHVDDCMRDAVDGMEIRGTYLGGRVTERWFFDEE